MKRRVLATGAGVVTSIGIGCAAFADSLRGGKTGIREHAEPAVGGPIEVKVAALLQDFEWQQELEKVWPGTSTDHARARKVLNNTPASTRWSVIAGLEACVQAGVAGTSFMEDAGLIIGGSNLSQEYVAKNLRQLEQSGTFNPRYALSFWDSNQLGCLSEVLGVHGSGWTTGTASASGNAALFQAYHAIRSGLVDRCLVVGAGSEFSRLELEAFAALGAIYKGQRAASEACRPFDQDHAGFVWGQGSGAVFLESEESAKGRGASVPGELAGASLFLDGSHLPEPSLACEIKAMRAALSNAGVEPGAIDLVNAHGTSAPLGDKTECSALRQVFGDHRPWVNSTKALTGHCMGAAGVIEAIACLIQINGGFAHPNINLERPIDPVLRFVGKQSEPCEAGCAISNGFGFGGINSSLVIKKWIN